MAEPLPETPTAAARTLILGLALGCAFRCVEKFGPDHYVDSGVSGFLAVGLTVMDYKLSSILAWAGPRATAQINRFAANPVVWVFLFAIFLLQGIFSPYVEKQQWPSAPQMFEAGFVIFAALVLSATAIFFRYRRTVRPMQTLAGIVLVVVGLGAIGCGIWVLFEGTDTRAFAIATAAAPHVLPPAPIHKTLSVDEIEFRKDLRGFVLLTLQNEADTFSQLTLRPPERGSSPQLSEQMKVPNAALGMLGNLIRLGYLKVWASLSESADMPIETLDVTAVISNLRNYMQAYGEALGQYENFLIVSGLNPNEDQRLSQWLVADQKALDGFNHLKSAPIAAQNDLVNFGSFASLNPKFKALSEPQRSQAVTATPSSQVPPLTTITPPTAPEDKTPINWQADFQLNYYSGPKMAWIRFIGQATSVAHIKDAYVISDLTGRKERLRISNPANFTEKWDIDQIEPIVSGAKIFLVYDFPTPLSVSDFLSQWGSFEFHVLYDDKEYVKKFSQTYVNDKIASEIPGVVGPRVTLKDKQ